MQSRNARFKQLWDDGAGDSQSLGKPIEGREREQKLRWVAIDGMHSVLSGSRGDDSSTMLFVVVQAPQPVHVKP